MTIRKCSECGNEIVLSERADARIGKMDIGCNNHDKAIVMWEVDAKHR